MTNEEYFRNKLIKEYTKKILRFVDVNADYRIQNVAIELIKIKNYEDEDGDSCTDYITTDGQIYTDVWRIETEVNWYNKAIEHQIEILKQEYKED